MAKPLKSKPNFLCCFGSFSHETSMRESDKLSWRRVRKKSDSKTVPLDASLPDEDKQHRVHSRKWRWKFFKSKSNSPKPLKESQPPPTNPKEPRQTPPVVPVTANYIPPQVYICSISSSANTCSLIPCFNTRYCFCLI